MRTTPVAMIDPKIEPTTTASATPPPKFNIDIMVPERQTQLPIGLQGPMGNDCLDSSTHLPDDFEREICDPFEDSTADWIRTRQRCNSTPIQHLRLVTIERVLDRIYKESASCSPCGIDQRAPTSLRIPIPHVSKPTMNPPAISLSLQWTKALSAARFPMQFV